MTKVDAAEEERSRMLFSKLRQVVTQKFGYGVKENKVSCVMIHKMKPGDFTKIVRNGAFYHIKRIYRELFTFRSETVTVTVQEGELKGRKAVSVLGKPFYKFLGIPYAKAPVGLLRFKDPEPAEPWKGVKSALKEGNMALQLDVITGLTRGCEDCLYLNVFTPELPQDGVQTEGKAVLFWIHGGGFNFGSGNGEIYGPDFFMEEDVLLVTFNYRLGVLGFLSTCTEDAPGNAGLKDMVLALKWVQQNIAAFGGDPNKITIFGESAGAGAVHYLMLSPLAKGLFQRAISQSGSAVCPWALAEKPLEAAFKLGRAFGLETKDPKVLADYLRKISSGVLVRKQTIAIPEENKRQCIPFAFLPSLEPSSYPNAFITERPLVLLENKKICSDVPYITGVTEREGTIFLRTIVNKTPLFKEIENDFERLVPRSLNLPCGSDQSKAVSEKIREFYFDNRPFNKKTIKEYADLATDTYFLMPMLTASKLQSKFAKSPIYMYQFMYDGGMGLLKKILNLKIPGPNHADDLGYLFHIPLIGPKLDPKSRDTNMRKKMIKLWTNFAKCGNPTPDPEDAELEGLQWKPFSESDQHYLVINDTLSVSKNMNEYRVAFWNDLKKDLSKTSGQLTDC